MYRSSRVSAFVGIGLCAALVAGTALTAQQRRFVRRPIVQPRRVIRAPFIPRPAPPVYVQGAPPDREAVQAMTLFLRDGLRQPYEGEQTTWIYSGGRVRGTHQSIIYAGPQRMRMDYTAPQNVAGEVILIAGGRFLHYKPRPRPHILEGLAPADQFEMRAMGLVQAMRRGNVNVRSLGQELIAGRPCTILEIRSTRGGEFYLKFWIDAERGVRLRYEQIGPEGRLVSQTVFTRVNYSPNLAPDAFSANRLPEAPHEAILPGGVPLASVSLAQQRVGYTIREPDVPVGFHLSGVWVSPGASARLTTIMQFTDGVNTFTLFEIPSANGSQATAGGNAQLREGVAHWRSGDLSFTLIGNLRPETAAVVTNSLR